MRFNDDKGQWLLLSAVIVSIGLGALVLLLNNAVLSGHSSTQAITSFPKNELRDLRSNSISEVLILGQTINSGGFGSNELAMRNAFNENFSLFRNEIYNMSLLNGGLIDITATPDTDLIGSKWIIANVSLSISYTDSHTTYTEQMVLGIAG